MAEIILYMTMRDVDLLRDWINREEAIAWIIKMGQSGREYQWQAVDTLATVKPGEYCLWHKATGPLNVPSGSADVPDNVVSDPYAGWIQHLDRQDATSPWFGGNLPGPYLFRFAPKGQEDAYAEVMRGRHYDANPNFNW